MIRARSGLLAGALLLVTACGGSPGDTVREAWQAREEENFEAYVQAFTERSGDLLRGIASTAERTRGSLSYMDPMKDLLPPGEIVIDRVDGELGTVVVAAAQGEYEIQCVRERGAWVIDALTLQETWAPLREATR